ncbi:MAG: ATP-binding protein [Lutibacter sp.]|uniref:response regulator n=1 Tax=Lutibacter sp. TaxID=1925666 RepID=UPI0038596B63
MSIFNQRPSVNKLNDIEKDKLSYLLLNEVNLMVVFCNKNGKINYVSPVTEKIIGYKAEDLLGDKWWNLTYFSREESDKIKKRLIDLAQIKKTNSFETYIREVKCKDGSSKWVEWRNLMAEDNSIISIGVNVNDWKKKEDIKNQSDKIIENVDSLIMVSNQKGEVIFASPSVKKMLGYETHEVMGDKWWEITYDDAYEAQKIKEAILDYVYLGKKDFIDITKRKIKTSKGNYKWIEWQLSKGVNGTFISVGTDITNRILTDIELKKAKETAEEALVAKNDFLANMSHEIRTPLNAVIGFTDLLLETELTKEQKLHLQTMKNSGEILLSIINDILDLSKLDLGKLEVESIAFDLHQQLREIVKLMKIKSDEKDIVLDLVIDPNTPIEVIGDPTRLGQILLNLIGNAIKFTDKGSVTVSVKETINEDNQTIIYCEIKDTGIGIVSNKINTVFGAFTQAQSDTSRIYGGTGLGLTIVKKLVHLLNGDIKVESKFGRGSNFKFSIPFKKGNNKGNLKDTIQDVSMDEPLNLSILLVDDNKTNQLLGKTRLERWGCTVDLANNGIEGVKKTQQKIYDVILMDIQMPVMDGYEATKIIKNDISEEVGKIPVIAMTAYTSKNDIKRAINAGMDDYIFKPFKPKEVYKLLHKYIKVSTKINQKKFNKSIEQSKIDKEDISYIDLTFLKEETQNESDILGMLIESFINDVDEFLEILDKGFKDKNWKILHEAAHKIKPSIKMFGISKLESIIHTLVVQFREEKELGRVEEPIEICKSVLQHVKDELLIELKRVNYE